MQTAVFDLPAVKKINPNIIAGDFFTDPLPEADLYGLGRILHDWTEPKIRTLLNRIYEALPAGGGLLIAEKLLGPKNVPAHMQSLNMLVCTEGRERSAEEYAELLRGAGFRSAESKRTGTLVDATLALK
jgi:acetylserotonin N-methyltransferase